MNQETMSECCEPYVEQWSP